MIETTFLTTMPRCSLERPWMSADGSDDHGRVVARWDDGPVLAPDYLCKPCLDMKLGFADYFDGHEPTSLTWVMTETQHWCGRHWWPAGLCNGWRHGPGYNLFGQPSWISESVVIGGRLHPVVAPGRAFGLSA